MDKRSAEYALKAFPANSPRIASSYEYGMEWLIILGSEPLNRGNRPLRIPPNIPIASKAFRNGVECAVAALSMAERHVDIERQRPCPIKSFHSYSLSARDEILERGQNLPTTRPFILDSSTGPKYLPSLELSRLSPRGRTCPDGT